MRLWPFGRASRSASDGLGAPTDAAVDPPSAFAEGPGPEVGAGGASPTADAPPRPSAPAWRLLDPPALSAAAPMPTTFDPHVERSLAAHLPVPQLAATARPLGHEVRRSAPVGVMGEVLRVVGTDEAALAPAVLGATDDLVLRPLRAPVDETAAATPAAGFAPALRSATAQPAASGGGATVVARSTDGTVADLPAAAAPLPAAAADGTGPSGTPSPASTPTRVLRSVDEPDAPLVGSLRTSPAPLLTALVARAADTDAGPAPTTPSDPDLPVVSAPPNLAAPLRRRMAVEVRDPSVPVSLDAFRAPEPPSSSPASPPAASSVTSAVQRSGDVASTDAPTSSNEPADEPPVQRAVVEATTDAADRPTLLRPTLGADGPAGTDGAGGVDAVSGRTLGLGAPLRRLPDSAVSSPPEADPFAGWADGEADALPLATGDQATVSRSFDDGAPGVSAASPTTGSVAVQRSSDQDPGSASGIDAPETVELPSSVLAPVRPLVAQREPLVPGVPEPIAALGGEVGTGPSVVPVAWPGTASATAGTAGGVGDAAVQRSTAPGVARPSGALGAQRVATEPGVSGPRVTPGSSVSGAAAPVLVGAPLAPVARAVLSDGPSPGPSTAAPVGMVRRASAGVWSSSDAGVVLASPFAGGSGPAVPLRRLIDGAGAATGGWSTDGASAGAVDVGPGSWQRHDEDGLAVASPLPVASIARADAASHGPTSVHRAIEPASAAAVAPRAPVTVGAVATWNGDDAPVQRSVIVPEQEVTVSAPDEGSGGSAAGQGTPGGGAAAPGDAEIDQLAGRLYERIRHRLRRELLDDRERAGISIDRVR